MKPTSFIQLTAFTLLLAAFAMQTHNVTKHQQANENLLTALNKSNDALDAANDSLAVAYDTMVADNLAMKAAGLALAQCRGEALPEWAEQATTDEGEWPQDEFGTDIGSLSAEQWDVLTDATDIVGVTREPQ